MWIALQNMQMGIRRQTKTSGGMRRINTYQHSWMHFVGVTHLLQLAKRSANANSTQGNTHHNIQYLWFNLPVAGAENTNRVLVISKWESLEDWINWKTDKKRMEIDNRLSELQDNPTIYEPYIFSKYKTAAELGFPHPLQNQQL